MLYSRSHNVGEVSLWAKFGILFGLFFVMLIGAGFCAKFIALTGLSERTQGLMVAFLQAILVFILPSLIYARVLSHDPIKVLALNHGIELKQIIGVVMVFIIGIPALNQIIHWNEAMRLPESMVSIETAIRDMENQAMRATEILLSTQSFWGMLMGVLVIGVITGFAEEIFFRGAIQRTMTDSGINHHMAIWITAFIFSTVHFQFFGFVPRLLLGAFFGYLLFWSESLWLSALAHALNNSIAVVTAWMIKMNLAESSIDKFGVNESGFPFVALLSALLVILLFANAKKIFSISPVNKFRPLKRNIR